MKYFKSHSGDVFGYCEKTQKDQIDFAYQNNWQDITNNWPPKPALKDELELKKIDVRQLLQNVAVSLGYDSAESLASYASSSIKKWKDEAVKFVKYRDSVWSWYFDKCEKAESTIDFMGDCPKWGE